MQLIYGGMLAAAVAGALTGGVMKVDFHSLDRPTGPQQVYSQDHVYGAEYFGDGPIRTTDAFADHVVGTDFLPGGRYNRPIQEIAYSDKIYEPTLADLNAKYGIREHAIAETLGAQATPDRSSQQAEVVLAHNQGGGQVYDPAHGSNPDAVVDEPGI